MLCGGGCGEAATQTSRAGVNGTFICDVGKTVGRNSTAEANQDARGAGTYCRQSCDLRFNNKHEPVYLLMIVKGA